ncbi:MAG: acyl-CoA/acyl-ACP dehydrogenase [Alphaproteobacteria bacterium]|nr:acyl-CoA/acyl-ACP dehydrogenase [Alphaproteobacteria bacterium]
MTTAAELFSQKYSDMGLQSPLGEVETSIQDMVHNFAKNILRPLGTRLDRMSAGEAIAEGSPYWDVMQQFAGLGITPSVLLSMSPEQQALVFPIFLEELGWGDAGLAISLGTSLVPLRLAHFFQNKFLIDNIPEQSIGCWGISEPDHGSDFVDFMGSEVSSRARQQANQI